MRANPGTAYVSVPAIGDVRGMPLIEPCLQADLTVVSAGLADGASALFLVSGHLQTQSGRIAELGKAEPVFTQLGFSPREGGDKPFTDQVTLRWRLSETGIERLEQIRGGGEFTLSVAVWYALIGGTSAPDWLESHRPIRTPFPNQPSQLVIKAHDWARDVLQPWQQAAAVSVVVALPQGGATDEHRTIVNRLAEAKRQLGAGEWKASISVSREACELLRKMRPPVIHDRAQDRDLAEREAAILDSVVKLTDSLFAYESAASHPDPHLRDITWNRQNAVLVLGTTASVAQLIFART